MPSPATPHATGATATGIPGMSTLAMPATPKTSSVRPLVTSRRRPRRGANCACTHAPAVQVKVAAVSATSDEQTLTTYRNQRQWKERFPSKEGHIEETQGRDSSRQ